MARRLPRAVQPTASGALATVEAEVAAVKSYAAAEKAEATRRAYRSDFDMFGTWCRARRDVEPLGVSPDTVAAYLASQASVGVRPSTLSRRLAAISYAHGLKGMASPAVHEAVRAVMRGIRRKEGTALVQKAPATAERVEAMLKAIPADTLAGKRDRALLLFGFAGAFRRSELVALEVSDLVFEPEGVRVTIRRSKADQEGQGQEVAILRGTKLRPVAALRAWLAAAGIEDGPVFRAVNRHGGVGSALTGQSVALVVKRWADAAGLDPAAFGGHSLRSGFLTSAADAGADVLRMMEVSRHKRVETVQGYVRRVGLFKGHAGEKFL